jgi:hypothetical protein
MAPIIHRRRKMPLYVFIPVLIGVAYYGLIFIVAGGTPNYTYGSTVLALTAVIAIRRYRSRHDVSPPGHIV